MSINIMFIPTNITEIALGEITRGENPRLPTNLKIAELSENIEAIGLLEPLHVWYNNEVPEVLRGHRRLDALVELNDRNPERMAEMYSDGIPCIVWDGIDKTQALMLKLDHSGQEPLRDPHELQMSASMMFNDGFSEAQVANQLKPLILRISPLAPSIGADIKKLEVKLAEAKEMGDSTSVAVIEKDIGERFAKGFRGRMQHLHNVARCPDIVNAALYFKACDIKLKGFEEKALPKLTTDHVKKLWKAHEEDIQDLNDSGVPKWDKVVVGPLFKEVWKGILEKEAEAESGTSPVKAKAMSAKDMKAEINGKWKCAGFYKLTKRHSGDKSVEGLDQLDAEYKAFDIVRQYDNDLFETVIAEAEKLQAKLADEALDTKED